VARHHDRRFDGTEYPTGGVYREVVEPARLVFTWADEPAHRGVPRGVAGRSHGAAGQGEGGHQGQRRLERRELPMVRVEKDYVFDSAEGRRSLLDLFDGRRQLIVYHAMWLFGDDQLCPSCSLLIDGLPHLSHLHARNTTLTAVARGPLDKLREYWQRMGWTVPVVSSAGSDFNWDFNVTVDPSVRPAEYNYAPMDGDWAGELPGTSVFLRDSDTVSHTYSSYTRGGDVQIGAYNYLNLTPLGRQEDWEQPPGRSDGPFMSWVRRHDEYDPTR